MKITVRRDRDDKGWIATMEGRFTGLNDGKVWREIVPCLLNVYKEHPDADVYFDDRKHCKLGNGMVFAIGDPEVQQVTFIGRNLS